MDKLTQPTTDRLSIFLEDGCAIPFDILDIIARNIGAGFAIISRDYRTVWASEFLKQAFGDVEGKVCYSTYNRRQEICENCGVREIFDAGRSEIKHEQAGRDVNGQMVWSEIIAIPIRNKDGDIVSALEIVIPVTERKRTEYAFRAIHAISQTINQSLDLEKVLNDALDNVMTLFKPHSAIIRLVEQNGKKMVFAAQKGLSPVELSLLNKRQDPGEGLTALSVDSGEVVVIEDLLTDPRTANKMGFSRRIGCRSVVTLPLYAKDKLVGNMSFRTLEPRPYSREEIELFTSIGHQIGVAIENAMLYKEREGHIGELMKAQRELKEAAAELENRVRERTANLEEMNRQLLHEIEERRRFQEECMRARKEAEAANAAKSEFLANMSHELRTPLHHIMGFTELMLNRSFGDLNETQQEYLADVFSSSNHLLSLINDILDLSKVEAGKQELALCEFDLRELLAESLMMFKEKTVKHGIQLSSECIDIPTTIHADRRRLKQILYNLLSNAVKYTADGGRVSLSARKCAGEEAGWMSGVEISVADSGIGLRTRDLERIFNPFEQVEGSKSRRFQGAGLGLALTKRFVELHGGRIWAESEGENKGSTFRFVIPCKNLPPSPRE
jgi:signal transduction histidine kinase